MQGLDKVRTNCQALFNVYYIVFATLWSCLQQLQDDVIFQILDKTSLPFVSVSLAASWGIVSQVSWRLE